MTTSLVFGASGFAGSHLCEELLARGRRVVGTATSLRPGLMPTGLEWHSCDVRSRSEVEGLVRRYQPDELYHLVAPAFVPDSFVDPTETYRVVVIGTSHVLEAVRTFSRETAVLLVTTGEVYGQGVSDGAALYPENAPFRPRSPYAAAKAAVDLMGQTAQDAFGLRVLRARPFNHFGPRQSARFACAAFARQIAAIVVGSAPPIVRVGNLEARRDFLHVKDIVRAYTTIMEVGTPGDVFNVCSGRSVSMRQVLEMLIGLSGVDVAIEVDPLRLRAVEVSEFSGNPEKLIHRTHWRPGFDLRAGLQDLLTHWIALARP